MHFERRAAAFEVVTLIDDAKGQLARFAHDRQPHAEAIGDRCAENESPRFDSQHHVDLAEPRLRDLVDDRREATRLADKRRDVLKRIPGFGKSGISRISFLISSLVISIYAAARYQERSIPKIHRPVGA